MVGPPSTAPHKLCSPTYILMGSSQNSGPFWGPFYKGAVLFWGPTKVATPMPAQPLLKPTRPHSALLGPLVVLALS